MLPMRFRHARDYAIIPVNAFLRISLAWHRFLPMMLPPDSDLLLNSMVGWCAEHLDGGFKEASNISSAGCIA